MFSIATQCYEKSLIQQMYQDKVELNQTQNAAKHTYTTPIHSTFHEQMEVYTMFRIMPEF